MKKVSWADRQVGDILLAACPGAMHNAIWLAERLSHPEAPLDFPVTHAAIIGPVAGWITEAWLGNGQDSVAAVVQDTKYDGQPVEVWRTGATNEQIWAAFQDYLHTYVPEHYGLPDLFGFEYKAMIRALTGKDIDNPIYTTPVCSEGVLLMMKLYCQHGCASLEWAMEIAVRDEDPLKLREHILAHA